MKRNIGQRIKAARERAGLTQTDVARAAGISQVYLHEIEAGKKDPFSRPTALLADLARALETTPKKLGG